MSTVTMNIVRNYVSKVNPEYITAGQRNGESFSSSRIFEQPGIDKQERVSLCQPVGDSKLLFTNVGDHFVENQ